MSLVLRKQAVVYPIYIASFFVLVSCSACWRGRFQFSCAPCAQHLLTRMVPLLQTVGLANRPETNFKTWATDEVGLIHVIAGALWLEGGFYQLVEASVLTISTRLCRPKPVSR